MLVFTLHAGIYAACWYLRCMHAGIYNACWYLGWMLVYLRCMLLFTLHAGVCAVCCWYLRCMLVSSIYSVMFLSECSTAQIPAWSANTSMHRKYQHVMFINTSKYSKYQHCYTS